MTKRPDWADDPPPYEPEPAPIREGWSKIPVYGDIEDRRDPMSVLQEFYDRTKNNAAMIGHSLTPDFIHEMRQAKPSPETSRDIDESVKGERLQSAMRELQYRESIPFPTRETSRQGIGFARPAAGGIYKDYGYEFENTPGQRVTPKDFDPYYPPSPIKPLRKPGEVEYETTTPEAIQAENQIIDTYNELYGGE
jgi:hypothetical protein